MIEFKPGDRLSDALGYIPSMLNEHNPDSAVKQLDDGYQHGGGWHKFDKFKFSPNTFALTYPGDPPMHPIARCNFRDELILVYPHAWVLVLQPDGSYEVARMD